MTEILAIKPRWMHGYANSPEIEVIVDKRPAYESFIWRACPDPHARRKTMLISTNQSPWVKFVYIDNPEGAPQYHGALGGDYTMQDGTVFKSRSGWSSRAGVINDKYRTYISGEICEVVLYEPGQKIGLAGFHIYALYLRNHPKWPKDLHLVREKRFSDLEIYHTISIDPNKVVKPPNGTLADNHITQP